MLQKEMIEAGVGEAGLVGEEVCMRCNANQLARKRQGESDCYPHVQKILSKLEVRHLHQHQGVVPIVRRPVIPEEVHHCVFPCLELVNHLHVLRVRSSTN